MESDKRTIIAHRCHKVGFDNDILPYQSWEKCIINDKASYDNFFTGAGGVLYPPHVLNNEVFNKDLFMALAPNADDIYFWAMALLNNTKIKVVDEPNTLIYINAERELNINGEHTLYELNKINNDIQLANIVRYFPSIIGKLKGDTANV